MGCFGFFNDGIMGSDIGVTVPRDSNQTWMAGNALNVCFSVCVFFSLPCLFTKGLDR